MLSLCIIIISVLRDLVVYYEEVACTQALLQWDWGERGTSYQALIFRPRAIFNGRACSQANEKAETSLAEKEKTKGARVEKDS